MPTTNQPRVSRDAIAEFQFIASRFDATQGRSSGVQVNAVTKSGTNTPSGSVSGYFRHDSFNAADFIQHEVLPYANEQVSATFGGPLIRTGCTSSRTSGVNYPFTNIARRAEPNWGVQMEIMERRSNYHAMVTGFTRRMRDRWQASRTRALYDNDPLPLSGLQQVTFAVSKDLGGEYGLATTDQRHRAVFNGIWDAGYGFQVSGLYFQLRTA